MPAPAREHVWQDPDYWLKDARFVGFLYWYYKIPDLLRGLDAQRRPLGHPATWKARGLTSFIIKIDPHVVLKLLKPWFRENTTLTDGTRAYAASLAALRDSQPHYTPRLHDNGDSWLLMENVEGQTLRQYWFNELVSLENQAQRFERTRQIMLQLSRALDQCHAKLGFHGDLSPLNILVIVEDVDDKQQVKLKLIDFGENYLISDQIGSHQAFVEHAAYIAPEIFDKQTAQAAYQASIPSRVLSDLYSFGAIVVELLGDDELSPLYGSRTPYETLGRLRSEPRYAGMDNLFDSLGLLLIGDPDYRALSILIESQAEHPPPLAPTAGADPTARHYRGIFDKLDAQFRDAANLTESKTDKPFVALLLRSLFVLNALELIRSRKEHLDGEAVALLGFAALSWVVSVSILVSRLMGGVALLDCTKVGSNCMTLPDWMGPERPVQLNLGFLKSDVDFLIGLSFVFMAFLYYGGIFGELDRRRLSRKAKWSLRLVALTPVAAGPLLASNSSTWPLLGLGAALLAANNIIFFRVASRSRHDIMTVRRTGHQSDIALPITAEMEALFAIFASWRVTTSLYAFFLLLVAVLTFAGKVSEVWLFGLLVLIANIEGIRRSMLNHGPGMRRMLRQYVDWAYRRRLVRSASSKLRDFHRVFREREHRGQHFAQSYLPGAGRYVVEVYDPREREDTQRELDAFLGQHGVQQAWLPLEVRYEQPAPALTVLVMQVGPSYLP